MRCAGYCCSILLLTCALAGCGDGGVPVTQPAGPPPLKGMLEGIAASGEPLGSQGMEIENHIEQLRAEDPAKADELSKDFDELRNMNNPQQIKSKASAMAKKL